MVVDNGIPAGRLVSARWRKSQASNPSGSCVQVAEPADGEFDDLGTRLLRAELAVPR